MGQRVEVETAFGRLLGRQDEGARRFLGVPYAAAPFGPRRMTEPAPVAPWVGFREALEYGATPPKPPYTWPFNELIPEPFVPGEDCLNLNIWSPADPGPHPVFVWIHGGGFLNGSGAVPQYDGTAFARSGIVCVTINYRLGADGYLDTGDNNTNLGIRDQLAALRWVRDNIAVFGGDPARVTVGGQSAGAMSVATLLACPDAVGLFRGAVLQSGAGHSAISRAAAQNVTSILAAQLGVAPTREALGRVPMTDLIAAEGAMALEVQTQPDPVKWGEVAATVMPFEPAIDGVLVPALPIDSIKAGAGADVNVLIGTNRDESLLPMGINGAMAHITSDVLRGIFTGYGFADVDAALKLYGAETATVPGQVLAAAACDWYFRIPAIRLAEVARNAPSFMYQFSWPSTAHDGALGACHSLEIPFVFDSLTSEGCELLTGPNPPAVLASEMHSAWVRFITDQEPGWASYSSQSRTVHIFGTPSSLADDPGGDRRLLWDGLR